MKKCFFLFLLLIFFFHQFSCKKQDITPAFLVLSKEDFEDCIEDDLIKFNKIHENNTFAPYQKEHFDAIRQQNFTDVLVSLNGKELGYWKLPCKIPLLPNYSGKNNIRIIPCVRVPATTLTAFPYYFVSPIERFFEIEKNGICEFKDFKFEYVPSIDFPILDIFTQTNSFKPLDTIFTTPMETVYDAELKKNIGKIVLEDSVDFFNVGTSFFYLNGHGVRHFWEMSYKCEAGEINTYLNFQNTITNVPQQEMIILPETNGWKKVYIDLSEVISWACGSADRVSVRLGIRGYSNFDSQKATFYFENIKLVTMSAPY